MALSARRPIVVAALVFLAANLALQALMVALEVPGAYGKDWGDELLGAKAWHLRRQVEATGGVSIAFLGASLTDAAVDPELLTRRLRLRQPAFVAGTNGADPVLLDTWSRALLRITRPRVVVIGLGPSDLTATNDWRVQQLTRSPEYRRTTGTRQVGSWWHRAMDDLEQAFRWVPVVHWRWNLRELELGPPMTPLGQDTTYLDGALPTRPSIRPGTAVDPSPPMAIPAANRRALDAMVDRFRRNGSAVVLLTMPLSATNAALQGDRQVPGYRSLLSQTADRLDVPLIDLDPRLGYDNRYFADGLHMNRIGSHAFTRALADELERNHPALLRRARSIRR